MKTRSLHNLIQKALDGALNDQEMQTWQEYLQQHPEQRAAYEEQAGMSRLLERMQEVEPPPHLTREILRSVRKRQAGRGALWQKIADSSMRELFNRPAYSFAAGLALGLLLLIVVLRLSSDNILRGTAQVSGTIGAAPGERFSQVVDLDQIRGQILWISQPNRMEVQLKLNPGIPATIQIAGLQENMTLTSFRGIRTRGIQELNLTPDKLAFQLANACDLTLEFSSGDQRPSPFQLQIYQAGKLCFARTLK